MKVRIGFNQADWIIEKNGLGTPKARNKYCLIYGGNPASYPVSNGRVGRN